MKRCSDYKLNISGRNGLVRVCDCHWMERVGLPGLPARQRWETWGKKKK